jgi:hypothetical protein
MYRRLLLVITGIALLATACGLAEQKVEEAAEEIAATSLAATSIAQTLSAPTPTPIVITATSAPGEELTPTPVVITATPVAGEEPIPTPSVDTTTMSEEELAAAIDEAVAEALLEAEQAAAATSTATADGAVTEEETVTVQVEVVGAEEALDEAEALIYAYYDLYGEYAEESIVVLQAIESDLSTIEDDVDYIATTVEQGAETATAVLTELQSAAADASANAAQAQAQAQDLLAQLQSKREERVQEALALAPSQIATSRAEAIHSAATYIETVRGSLADGIVSQPELSAITQAGANATAGLNAQGGPGSAGLSASIGNMTTQIARGDVPQARADLGGLEAQFQGLPERPELPEPQGPSRPEGPSRPGG